MNIHTPVYIDKYTNNVSPHANKPFVSKEIDDRNQCNNSHSALTSLLVKRQKLKFQHFKYK